MKYTIEKTEKYSLIQLHENNLTSVISPDLKSEFVKINAEGTVNIILDLSEVSFVDSSGLSSILVGNRLCENEEGLFILTAPSDHVMKLIKISQLEKILTIHPSVEEAIDAVFMHEIEKNLRDETNDD